MYKCCWNCANGMICWAPDKERMERLNASKRFCCAQNPISDHAENPFKQRYCKQFDPSLYFDHEITKKEAEKLNNMTEDELVEYWHAHRHKPENDTSVCAATGVPCCHCQPGPCGNRKGGTP